MKTDMVKKKRIDRNNNNIIRNVTRRNNLQSTYTKSGKLKGRKIKKITR